MTLLAPMFAVAGLLLVGVPVLIHLLNRRRYKVVDWAAMQFLLAAMKKNRRRLRFEQWLLLALRCLLIAGMGVALARPAGCDRTTLARLAGRTAGLHVIVLDNSYSMAYEADRPDAKTNLDQAKKVAKRLIGSLTGGGDAVVLITAARPAAAVLSTPTYDLAAVAAAIDRVPQTAADTDLAGAFDLALRAGETGGASQKFLDVLSDGTASAWRSENTAALTAAGPRLAAAFRVRLFNLSVPNATNNAVIDVSPTTNLVRTRFANDFRATARALGSPTEATLLWTLNGESLPGGSSVLLDAQTPPQTQSNARLRTGGPTVLTAKLAAADRLPLDDSRSRTLDVAAEMNVLIVEGRRGATTLDGSGAFLEFALAPPPPAGEPGVRTASYIKPERISDIELGSRTLDDYRAILIADVAQVSASVADGLAAFVKRGGTLVFFGGEQVQRENYNATLAARGLLPGPLVQRQSGPGFTFAFNPAGDNHPLLAAFANLDKSGLDTARAFTYWQVTPKPELKVQRVLNFAGSGDPAITLHTLGLGRVVFIASSADAEWTDFPAKPAYVALLHEILAGTVSGSERWLNVEVGGRLSLPVSVKTFRTPSLRMPDGTTETPLEPASGGETAWQSPPLVRPGVYTLSTGVADVPISVNVPAAEADIRPVTESAIRQSLGNIEIDFEGADVPPESVAEDSGRDFGWSLMLAVLALLGVESYFAMRFGHHRRPAA